MQNSAVRRSGAPVWRHSREAGRCEGAFWRRFDPHDVGRIMLGAERFERARKRKGERNGPLGAIGLEVLRELLRLVDYKTGRLDPSIATLMTRLNRSKDAVVRALVALRENGFVDWLRRWAPDPDNAAHAVKQETNAYRITLPPAAARLLGFSVARDAPAPDDEAARREDHKAETTEMRRQGVALDPGGGIGHGGLAAVMRRVGLGRLLPQGESLPGGMKPGGD